MRRIQKSRERFSKSTGIFIWRKEAMVLWLCTGVLAAAICARGADGTGAGIDFGPPSPWVSPHLWGQQSVAAVDSGTDERVLLREQQMNVVSNETFVHSIRQMLTTAGVQRGSTISIDFNPGYEELTLHWARIWRAGQHLERLDTNAVRVVQREQDLDQYMLNGQKSAVLVMDDVRVGDVIDYAYSLKGTNPIFTGHFDAEIPVQLDEPADRLFTRVVWPKARHLYAQTHGCNVVPKVITGTNVMEYIWDVRQVPGLTLEDSLPGWYEPEPWVQLTDFASWAEVNRWALSLFQSDGSLSPELARRVAEWKQLPDQEQQILAALRFVQDDVRYFGVEIGVSTEKPAEPSVVFSRRYGDCKDKSWLLVSVLRALGIEAYPVLVNSTAGHALDDWRPSAGAFDHCITVVRWNGQVYWLDPTINYQRGSLAAHYLPPYERGLVVSPQTKGLLVIPPSADGERTMTTEYFQLGGREQGATLRVVSVAVGRDADRLRNLFATTKRGDIEKSYTHYYADEYPGIKMSTPLDMTDDEGQNLIQTTEYYSLGKAWTWSDQDSKYHFDIYPASMAVLLRKPRETDRVMPLGVDFPEHQILRTEVSLPRVFPADTQSKSFVDPAFTFQKSYSCSGSKLVMQYEYQAQGDSVAPEAVGQYVQSINQSLQSIGYVLVWR